MIVKTIYKELTATTKTGLLAKGISRYGKGARGINGRTTEKTPSVPSIIISEVVSALNPLNLPLATFLRGEK